MTRLTCSQCGRSESVAGLGPGRIIPCPCGDWLRGPRFVRSKAHREPLQFLVSSQLGKLAAYLRLLGYNTLWQRFDELDLLIKTALDEDRILLTPDKTVQQRVNATDVIVLAEESPDDQLRTLAKFYPLKTHTLAFALCSRCNVDLVSTDSNSAQTPKTDSFYQCPLCEKTYRESTHRRLMQRLF